MASPIHQFEIQPIKPFSLGGIDISFTNSSLWMTIGVATAVVLFWVATANMKLVPARMQMIGEIFYGLIHKMVNDSIGPKGLRYFPLVFTVFIFVLMGNLLGLLPGSFTYTSHLAVTGALALLVFSIVIVCGLAFNGLHFFSLFLPAGLPWFLMPFILPIEIISFFVRPLTLSVRLFANMMAGHIMLKIVAGFSVAAAGMGLTGYALGLAPTLINVVMIAFELLVAMIQAYVFAILTCVYLKDTVDIHH